MSKSYKLVEMIIRTFRTTTLTTSSIVRELRGRFWVLRFGVNEFVFTRNRWYLRSMFFVSQSEVNVGGFTTYRRAIRDRPKYRLNEEILFLANLSLFSTMWEEKRWFWTRNSRKSEWNTLSKTSSFNKLVAVIK